MICGTSVPSLRITAPSLAPADDVAAGTSNAKAAHREIQRDDIT
jgi:hypothetical protein